MATAGSARFELHSGSRGTAGCRRSGSVQCCDVNGADTQMFRESASSTTTGPNHQLTHQHTEEPSRFMGREC